MPAIPSITPVAEELADPLLAQALDVHRAAAHELLDRLEQLAGAAGAVGADRPDAALRLARSACRRTGSCSGGSGSGERFFALLRLGGGRDHARDHVAGAGHDHLVALAHVLARDVLLVVERGELHGHAGDLHRLELGEGHHVARCGPRSTSPAPAWWWRSSAGTSRRSPRAARGPPRPAGAAARGRRPSPPRRRSRSRATRGAPPSPAGRRRPRRACRGARCRG